MKKVGAKHHLLVFSRRERTGIWVLLTLAIAAYCLPYLIPSKELPDIVWLDGDETAQSITANEALSNAYDSARHYFPFDPNTATTAVWRQLGVDSQLARRILNYTSKGGQFRKPEDLGRIWGMPPALAAALMPYVRITLPERKMWERHTPQPIDLNLADTQALQTLPGIGPVMARRMVQYREQFGSIIQREELLQIKGMNDSLLNRLRPLLLLSPAHIRTTPLNHATAWLLSTKAGLSSWLSRSIVTRRQRDGPYSSWQELQNLEGMEPHHLKALQLAFHLDNGYD